MTFSDYMDYLRDKRIGVIGFGVSNQPLVRVLLRNGCDVTVCDRRERAQLGAAGDEAAAQGAKRRDPHLRDGGILQPLPVPHHRHHRQRRQDYDLDHYGRAPACAGVYRTPRRQHRHAAL